MQTKRILVVTHSRRSTDNIHARLVANTTLKFAVTHSSKHPRTLRLLRTHRWDIVVLDAAMDKNLLQFVPPETSTILCYRHSHAMTMPSFHAASTHSQPHHTLTQLIHRAINTAPPIPTTHNNDKLDEAEARYQALVSNLPGVVFQLKKRGPSITCTLMSDGCYALFALASEYFVDHPIQTLVSRIIKSNQVSFLKALTESSNTMRTLNWEGAIVISNGKEIKWINVRGSPRLGLANDIIWDGTMMNVTEARLASQEVSLQRMRLAELSSHLQTAKEDERERIARDVHDEIGSTLVGLRMQIALLSTELANKNPELHQKAQEIDKAIVNAIDITGRIAREMRPGILKEFGLTAAIECLLEDFHVRSGVATHLLSDGQDTHPEHAASLVAFRITQESLTNIGKHAQAKHVTVSIKNDQTCLTLSIEDNGRGISSTDLGKRKTFGIRGMRERVRALGGTLDVHSPTSNGSGTQLLITIPLAKIDEKNKQDDRRQRNRRSAIQVTIPSGPNEHPPESHFSD